MSAFDSDYYDRLRKEKEEHRQSSKAKQEIKKAAGKENLLPPIVLSLPSVWDNEKTKEEFNKLWEQGALKPSNPKDSVGIKKVPFSTVPAEVIAEIGLAMLEGARKYGRHNYRIIGVKASVYYDAALRHLTSWFEGQDIDPDSGLSHITKALACLTVLRDGMIIGNWVDDRPPSLDENWIKELNSKAEEIIERYPDAKEVYTNNSV